MQDKKASVRFIERCYKLYEQKMYQIAYSILRDEGLAEDAVQDAFLKLMKGDISFENAKSDEENDFEQAEELIGESFSYKVKIF